MVVGHFEGEKEGIKNQQLTGVTGRPPQTHTPLFITHSVVKPGEAIQSVIVTAQEVFLEEYNTETITEVKNLMDSLFIF